MAVSNHERVDKALDLLRVGLGSFMERELKGTTEGRRVGVPGGDVV